MNIAELFKHLTRHSPVEIFRDADDKKAIDGKLAEYALICHPDKNPIHYDKATECFQLLNDKYTDLTGGVIITSKEGSYEVDKNPFAKGDIADIYRGGGHVLKITRNGKYTKLMSNEEKVLKKIVPEINGKSKAYFPELLDAFAIRKRNEGTRVCHVFSYDVNLYSLLQVKQKRDILNPRSFVWMFKRMLSALALTHSQGYVHGAVNPEHFLVNKMNHGGTLIDWIHAVPIGDKVKTISKKWKHLYPIEILNKESVGFETDLYMAGKCGIYILSTIGGIHEKVPRKIASFLDGLVLRSIRSRPDDAWSIYQEFSDLAANLYGKPEFIELQM